MSRIFGSLALLLVWALVQAESTAFVNVNVLPMTSSEVLQARTVVVTRGKIAAIGPAGSTSLPRNAVVVDGTDRYLMPGLAEMHAHVPPTTSPDLERVLQLFVANGVTTVRGMLGKPGHLDLREAIARGETLGPRLVTSGPSFNGRSVDGADSAVAMVRQQHAAGYDFLKIHPGLSRFEFAAIAATANELRMPFAGHVPEDVGVLGALQAGIASIDHLDGYMQLLLPPDVDPSGGLGGFFGLLLAGAAQEQYIMPAAEATADAGVWNVPTQSLFEHVAMAIDPEVLAERPEMRYMPVATLRQWEERKREVIDDVSYDPAVAERAIDLRRQLILALHRAGDELLLGSDSPQVFNVPGFAIHRELQYLVGAGLSKESGIPTFRGGDGLWDKHGEPPMD
ncbi:MAG: amidohydrolase family protein, partial [Woeseia sp.]